MASNTRNLGIVDAFDDCIDRLARGQSLQACLEVYPQYAAELAPMLETGVAVIRGADIDAEWSEIQAGMEARFERALSNGGVDVRRGAAVWVRLLGTVASLLLVLVIALNGLALVSQESLPGDTLYGYKRFTESIRLSLVDSSGVDILTEEFARRRLDETQAVLDDGRVVEVDFTGVIEDVELESILSPDDFSGSMTVSGLEVTITTQTLADQPSLMQILLPGTLVHVRAITTADRRLVASAITPIEPAPPVPEMTPTANATAAVTASGTPSETSRPSATPSSSPTPANVNPTGIPTATPNASISHTLVPTTTVDVATPTITMTGSVDGCVARPPQGWVAYIIQVGDTLSGLASRSGASTIESIMRVNCLEDSRRIIAGTRLYLPSYPTRRNGEGGEDGFELTASAAPGGQRGEDLQGTLRATQATHIPTIPPATPTPGRGRRR